ncbi:MAG TPA: single-stranded DNA-binding protein [Planktothrix sp.]
MSIANVSIVGNLVRAPEKTVFQSGKVKTTLTVAVDKPRRKDGAQGADFYKIVVWDKFAQIVADRLDKGNQVTAHGRLLMDEWEDREGRKRMTPTIAAYNIAFPQRPKSSRSDNSAYEMAAERYSAPREIREMTPSRATTEPEFTTTSFDQNEIAFDDPQAANKRPKKSGDDEDSEYTEDEDESSDGFGEPNRVPRPAPERERSPVPA